LGDVMRYTVAPLTGRLLLERTVETMFAPAPVPDSFWDAVPREMLLRPKQIRAVAQDGALMVPAAAYLRTHYPKLDIPVRIFAGDGDKIVDTEAHSAPLHRALPHSTLLVAPGVGHMAHYQLVSQIVAAIDRITINRDEMRNDSVVGAIGAAETSLVR
jgi:pimeloyl-ACP methyl ester carboxylesterase